MQMKISGKQNFPETIFKNLYSQHGKLYKVEFSINFKTEFLSEITMYSKQSILHLQFYCVFIFILPLDTKEAVDFPLGKSNLQI